ncbi:MAG: hypothetical protein ACKVHR_06270 [Pirellulales bacterium]|jgi:hypothetical protein
MYLIEAGIVNRRFIDPFSENSIFGLLGKSKIGCPVLVYRRSYYSLNGADSANAGGCLCGSLDRVVVGLCWHRVVRILRDSLNILMLRNKPVDLVAELINQMTFG